MYTMSDSGCLGLNIITGNVAILILHSYMSTFSVMNLGKPLSPGYIADFDPEEDEEDPEEDPADHPVDGGDNDDNESSDDDDDDDDVVKDEEDEEEEEEEEYLAPADPSTVLIYDLVPSS
ncbi:hypothetical protein Tco_1365324 [Tanacetum coccineum]